MAGGKLDLGADAGRGLPGADQPGVGRAPERQAERIEQDRLARPGLAGQRAKPRLELELEPVDQHHIVDDELPQHVEAQPVRDQLCGAAGTWRWISL